MWSVDRAQGEGFQETIRKIALSDSDELGDGRTRLFPVVAKNTDIASVLEEVDGTLQFGCWDKDDDKKQVVIGMMTSGPRGRRKFGGKKGGEMAQEAPLYHFPWERSNDSPAFLRMLEKGATEQSMADYFPEIARSKRFETLIVVHEAEEGTYHEKPINKAFVMTEKEQHGMETKHKPGVACECGCGTPRDAFTFDKPSADSKGVLIISDAPCVSCGSTALVSPVPENSLRDVLDKHFAPKR